MKITYPLPPNLPEQLPLLTNCQLEDEAILENHLYQQIDLPNQVRNLVFRCCFRSSFISKWPLLLM